MDNNTTPPGGTLDEGEPFPIDLGSVPVGSSIYLTIHINVNTEALSIHNRDDFSIRHGRARNPQPGFDRCYGIDCGFSSVF